VLLIGLNSRRAAADSRVEQTPVGEGGQRSLHQGAHFGACRAASRPGHPNDKRGTASETAYGCAGGAKLWRVQPHERIRHETRPAGTGRMNASRGRENLRTQVKRVRQARFVMLLPRAGRR